jgi:hypothetical protein
MNIDAAIVVGAIAGGVTGGIVAVILTLGLLRRERLTSGRTTTLHVGPASESKLWRVASGPLTRREAVRTPAPTESPETQK